MTRNSTTRPATDPGHGRTAGQSTARNAPAAPVLDAAVARDPVRAQDQVGASLLGLFDAMCEGVISVDRDARIIWINEKYLSLLGLRDAAEVVGCDVETVIPESQMRQVVQSGRPILLDIMRFADQHFVVSRLPLVSEDGTVTGAVGFVLYERLDQLQPLIAKFEQLRADLARARAQLDAERRARYSFSSFVGNSIAAQAVKRTARRAAATDSPVLILGETGTGKELLAQAIHATSPRASGRFVAVNAAAVPETLLESEFFGAAPGAYTGASRTQRDGKLKLADGGTLFLDEIGDMPMALQVKLLRVLEEQAFEPLGSNRLVRVNVRIVAATSADLSASVAAGRFRRDLYYRLNVLTVSVPALRDRLDDLGPLAESLLERIARAGGTPPRDLDQAALGLLARHDWPGNVRELRNVLERACLANDRLVLSATEIAAVLPHLPSDSGRARGTAASLAAGLASRERELVAAALVEAGGNRTAAARLLGISRSQLYQKMNQHDLSGK